MTTSKRPNVQTSKCFDRFAIVHDWIAGSGSSDSRRDHPVAHRPHWTFGRFKWAVGSRQPAHRRGFSLLESLMAAGILLMIVVAVTGAIVAGQQHAHEARQRIAGAIAAEELIGRLATTPYDELASWNGYTEDVGEMADINGALLPPSFASIGRTVEIESALRSPSGVSAKVFGREVLVIAFDGHGRTLAELHCFIPQPPEQSIPDALQDPLGILKSVPLKLF